jgi:hypothetical protein
MNSFFVGNKVKPSYLVEIASKNVNIYKPDKYSKLEKDFYEKYSLGELVFTSKYTSITFEKKPVVYKKKYYMPEIIFKIKNKFLVVSKTLKEKDSL